MAPTMRSLEVMCVFYIQFFITIGPASAAACRGLSADVNCQCDDNGHCMKGTVEIDPWLQNTLKTQRETQLDIPFDHMQLLGAHNTYNNRAYGLLYGANDSCYWPPPYTTPCLDVANQEFSIVDLLNMGIRAFELDNWYCYGAMRIAHLATGQKTMCSEDHVLFSDVIADVGAWLDRPDNEGEIIRIYINEKYDQGHDADVNGPLGRYLGHDRILRPADLTDTYGGVWPTGKQMRMDGKQVVIGHGSSGGLDGGSYVHQGKYIHAQFWKDIGVRKFTNYPQCGGKNDSNHLRFSADSTHYGPGPLDGPTRTGVILNLAELIKCRVQYPAGDQVTPQLLKTAVYSWAEGQPSQSIDEETCVMLSASDFRWYTPTDCLQKLHYPCRNTNEPSDWLTTELKGPYGVQGEVCPTGYEFGLPQNGYQHQKLLESLHGRSVWLNFESMLPGYTPAYPTGHVPFPSSSPPSPLRTSQFYHILFQFLMTCIIGITP